MTRIPQPASSRVRPARLVFLLGFLATITPVLAAAATTGGQKGSTLFEWRPFLGPFHSLVLHYPIGFLTMALVLEAFEWFKKGADFASVKKLVLHLSLWTGLASAGLGWLRAGSGGYDSTAVDTHRVFGIAIPFITVLALVTLSLSVSKPDSFARKLTYRASLLATLVLLMLAGHSGGNLTHGSNYLVQNAPSFVKSWMQEPQAAETSTNGLSPAQKLFAEMVKPAFDKKCLSCHGPEKQKGKYRIDLAERAMKGGESGKPAIVAGEPMQSTLLKVIMLPPNHDDVMPPEGKAPMTPEEIVAISRWIQAGAPFLQNPGADPSKVETGNHH